MTEFKVGDEVEVRFRGVIKSAAINGQTLGCYKVKDTGGWSHFVYPAPGAMIGVRPQVKPGQVWLASSHSYFARERLLGGGVYFVSDTSATNAGWWAADKTTEEFFAAFPGAKLVYSPPDQ
jgi:hypothetical protein